MMQMAVMFGVVMVEAYYSMFSECVLCILVYFIV